MNSKDHKPFWTRNDIVLRTEEDVDALKLTKTFHIHELKNRYLYRFDITLPYQLGTRQFFVDGTMIEVFEYMKETFKLHIREGYVIRNPHLCMIGENWLEENKNDRN